ncbi:hypothetical protein BJ138DRAFT_626681 [Hygrophoropsis aurantiaca]|uniref:Uncharacterized protein n=1 Tax=Hygrophoropsis aurantiaca TaxID=72124 RepID=A0ACB7ZZB7_9AGAM|nr:hypothetical protein BJ138DRAFT_626681 [Hygrophoropsis aurantiaca]
MSTRGVIGMSVAAATMTMTAAFACTRNRQLRTPVRGRASGCDFHAPGYEDWNVMHAKHTGLFQSSRWLSHPGSGYFVYRRFAATYPCPNVWTGIGSKSTLTCPCNAVVSTSVACHHSRCR